MMSGSSNAPEQFYPYVPMFQISVAPLAVSPPPRSDFGFNYEIVQHTPSGSLFDIGPSASLARDDNKDDDNDDTEVNDDEDDDDEDEAEAIRRNRRLPRYGTGGHRRC
ncbi:hypothetical protein V6N13_007842 [Hibiscus sabdariffa]